MQTIMILRAKKTLPEVISLRRLCRHHILWAAGKADNWAQAAKAAKSRQV